MFMNYIGYNYLLMWQRMLAVHLILQLVKVEQGQYKQVERKFRNPE